jgi:hypothetical protein
MTDFAGLIRILIEHGVRFILVGGASATAHGASRLTQDLEIVYQRAPANMAALAAALKPHSPYLRGAPSGLPFSLDAETIARGLNFTLTTTLGDLDLLGEMTGGERYEDLLPDTIELTLFGVSCRCLGLRRLIEVKRAAGRPRGLEAVAELEAILEEGTRHRPILFGMTCAHGRAVPSLKRSKEHDQVMSSGKPGPGPRSSRSDPAENTPGRSR